MMDVAEEVAGESTPMGEEAPAAAAAFYYPAEARALAQSVIIRMPEGGVTWLASGAGCQLAPI